VGDTNDLVQRIEGYLEGRGDVTGGRVLGGEGVFLDGYLVAAVMDHDLCVPLRSEAAGDLAVSEGVRPLLFAGRPVTGWVLVESGSVTKDDELARWIEAGLARR